MLCGGGGGSVWQGDFHENATRALPVVYIYTYFFPSPTHISIPPFSSLGISHVTVSHFPTPMALPLPLPVRSRSLLSQQLAPTDEFELFPSCERDCACKFLIWELTLKFCLPRRKEGVLWWVIDTESGIVGVGTGRCVWFDSSERFIYKGEEFD